MDFCAEHVKRIDTPNCVMLKSYEGRAGEQFPVRGIDSKFTWSAGKFCALRMQFCAEASQGWVTEQDSTAGRRSNTLNRFGMEDFICPKGQTFIRYSSSVQARLLSDRPVNSTIQERRPVKRFAD